MNAVASVCEPTTRAVGLKIVRAKVARIAEKICSSCDGALREDSRIVASSDGIPRIARLIVQLMRRDSSILATLVRDYFGYSIIFVLISKNYHQTCVCVCVFFFI